MRAADKYARQVNTLLISIENADGLTAELDARINDLLRVLRNSRWEGRFSSRVKLCNARDYLNSKHRPKLRLIQGGNDFLARRSKAVLTLIVTSDLNNQKKVG